MALKMLATEQINHTMIVYTLYLTGDLFGPTQFSITAPGLIRLA